MSEEEDKPTVVLDFSEIKSQLEDKEDILGTEDSFADLEFSTEKQESPKSLFQEFNPKVKINVYLFSYMTDYFDKKRSFLNQACDTKSINEVKNLNEALTNDPESVIVFYYNGNPKAVNQLSMQIKEKFPLTKTLIIAENLSAKKAKQHRDSKYGSDAYLNDPFPIEDFKAAIKDLESL